MEGVQLSLKGVVYADCLTSSPTPHHPHLPRKGIISLQQFRNGEVGIPPSSVNIRFSNLDKSKMRYEK